MYCHKFLYRIPYNNFSGKRGEGCWGVHREETDRRKKNKVHGSFNVIIFLSKSFGICYVLLHFLKYNRVCFVR